MYLHINRYCYTISKFKISKYQEVEFVWTVARNNLIDLAAKKNQNYRRNGVVKAVFYTIANALSDLKMTLDSTRPKVHMLYYFLESQILIHFAVW